MSWVLLALRGCALGLAALVPGVSGGTIALVTGIYERLIEAVRSFYKRQNWPFLLTVGGGAVAAMIAFAPLVRYLLNHLPEQTYLFAVFFGVIVGSIYFCARRVERWGWSRWIALAAGIVIAFFVSVLSSTPSRARETYDVPLTRAKLERIDRLADAANYSLATETLSNVTPSELAAMQVEGLIRSEEVVHSDLDERSGPAGEFVAPDTYSGFNFRVLAAGVVAAWALLLPGISGAYVLQVLGFYSDSIANFTLMGRALVMGEVSGDAVLFMLSLAVGVIIGVLAFSHVIGVLLRQFHAVTMALLTGFLVGSLRAVWPWWTSEWILNPLRLEYGLELRLLHPTWPDPATLAFWIALVWLLGSALVTIALEGIPWRLKKS